MGKNMITKQLCKFPLKKTKKTKSHANAWSIRKVDRYYVDQSGTSNCGELCNMTFLCTLQQDLNDDNDGDSQWQFYC